MMSGCIAFLLFVQLNENPDQSLWMLPLIMLVGALLIGFFFSYICQKKLGGMTGDTYGALNELVELGLLFVIILWAGGY